MTLLSATLAIAGVAIPTASQQEVTPEQTSDIPPDIFYYHDWRTGRRVKPFLVPPVYVQHPDFKSSPPLGDANTSGFSTDIFVKEVAPGRFQYAHLHFDYQNRRTGNYSSQGPRDGPMFYSKYGDVGDVSVLTFATPPNVREPTVDASTWVDGIHLRFWAKTNGMALIGYQVHNPEPAFGILRYATAVLLANCYEKPVTKDQRVNGITLPTYKLHSNGSIAYRLTSLFQPNEISVSANYYEGVLNWKINSKTFTVPLASKSYWINGTRYSTDTFSVIHDGSFYVSKDIIEQSINALGK